MSAAEVARRSTREAETLEVIFICAVEERSLVALPQPAWNRRAENRRLPPGALVRATAAEVAAAARGSQADCGYLPLGVEVAKDNQVSVPDGGERRAATSGAVEPAPRAAHLQDTETYMEKRRKLQNRKASPARMDTRPPRSPSPRRRQRGPTRTVRESCCAWWRCCC